MLRVQTCEIGGCTQLTRSLKFVTLTLAHVPQNRVLK
jgi:hypothetical protein